jgi:cysteine desulfurase
LKPLCAGHALLMSAGAAAAPLAYLDCNATTPMPEAAVDATVRWMNRGDPAGVYASAREAQRMVQRFRRQIAVDGGFELEGPRGFTLVFTSGASESNTHVVVAAARAYAARTGKLPHVVVGGAEHDSLLDACRRLEADGLARVALVPVRVATAPDGDAGTVDPAEVRRALRPNTCLVCVAAADGVTGAVNDLAAIGAVAHGARVPLYADAAMLFGRAPLRPAELCVDAFGASFHKFGGPPGAGLLGVRNDFLAGYGLGPLVAGGGPERLRGGIENVPALAGAFAAYRLALDGRPEKNRRLARLRDAARAGVARLAPAIDAADYCRRGRPPDSGGGRPLVVWLSPRDRAKTLFNTLLFAVLLPPPADFSARDACAALAREGVIVGPAADAEALVAVGAPPELRRGAIRVSVGDATSDADVAALVAALGSVLAAAPGRPSA